MVRNALPPPANRWYLSSSFRTNRIRLKEGSKKRAPKLLPLIGIEKSVIRVNDIGIPTMKQAKPNAQGLGMYNFVIAESSADTPAAIIAEAKARI